MGGIIDWITEMVVVGNWDAPILVSVLVAIFMFLVDKIGNINQRKLNSDQEK